MISANHSISYHKHYSSLLVLSVLWINWRLNVEVCRFMCFNTETNPTCTINISHKSSYMKARKEGRNKRPVKITSWRAWVRGRGFRLHETLGIFWLLDKYLRSQNELGSLKLTTEGFRSTRVVGHLSVACLSPRRSGFDSRSDNVGFVVNKMPLRRDALCVVLSEPFQHYDEFCHSFITRSIWSLQMTPSLTFRRLMSTIVDAPHR